MIGKHNANVCPFSGKSRRNTESAESLRSKRIIFSLFPVAQQNLNVQMVFKIYKK